ASSCEAMHWYLLGHIISNCSVFFFQAEDGIRDKLVTGVQTCALPISSCTTAADSRRVTVFQCRSMNTPATTVCRITIGTIMISRDRKSVVYGKECRYRRAP